jgi:hypothetical protein
MTTRDYKLLAKAMAEAYQQVSHAELKFQYGVDITVQKLCDAMLIDNVHFDKEKFIAAIAAYQCNGEKVK